MSVGSFLFFQVHETYGLKFWQLWTNTIFDPLYFEMASLSTNWEQLREVFFKWDFDYKISCPMLDWSFARLNVGIMNLESLVIYVYSEDFFPLKPKAEWKFVNISQEQVAFSFKLYFIWSSLTLYNPRTRSYVPLSDHLNYII